MPTRRQKMNRRRDIQIKTRASNSLRKAKERLRREARLKAIAES